MSSSYVALGEDDFTEQSIRLKFIRNYFIIYTVQLLIAAAVIGVFTFEESVQQYFQVYYGYKIVAAFLFIVGAIMIHPRLLKLRTPVFFIGLFLVTTASSFFLALNLVYGKEVMLAIGMITAILFGLTISTFQTKIDFTKWGGALFALILILIVSGIFLCFFPSRVYQTILAGLCAFVFSCSFTLNINIGACNFIANQRGNLSTSTEA